MKEIILTNGMVSPVSDEWYDRLVGTTWAAHYDKHAKSYYARHAFRIGKKTSTIFMHRLIMNAVTGQIVDHINHDTLDNRLENLRICTNSQNHGNQRKYRGVTSSRFKGVDWDKSEQCWRARIQFNGKRVQVASGLPEEECARAYDAAAKKYFGEFALLNFPDEIDQPLDKQLELMV